MIRTLLSSALVLFLLPHGLAAGEGYRLRATPLLTISYPPPAIAISDHGQIAFSDGFAFFGTDGGLFRAALPITRESRPQRVAFESTPLTGLAHRGGSLYAILDIDHPTGPGATKRSLLKSTDEGITWTPIDAALEECSFGFCEFLPSSQIEV